MSMMMKLINAAAGQSVGDEIYFIQSSAAIGGVRLVKIDFDAETVTAGSVPSAGVYSDTTAGITSAASYTYSGNSNSTCVVGNDGYLYAVLKSDLDATYGSAQGGTSILVRWNMKSLEIDPGFFYNLLAEDSNSSTTVVQNPQQILFHEPSQTMSVVGDTHIQAAGQTAVAYSFKIFPWPTSGIDALSSGAYHSTSNPNGRTMGTFLQNDNDSYAVRTSYGTSGYDRLHLMSNGKDQLGVTTRAINGTRSMSFKKAYSKTSVPSGSYESYNVGSGNFAYETTSSQNPWLEMTGHALPFLTGTWKDISSSGNSGSGITNIYYRPGRDTAGIHKTPGTYYVMTYDGAFFTFQEGSTKVEELTNVNDQGTYAFSYRYTLLDNGCLVRRVVWTGDGSNFSGAAIRLYDLDNRMYFQNPNGGTIHTGAYATTFQHTPVVGSANDERIPLSKNPNDEHIDTIVQTKSGRMFAFLTPETSTEVPPLGGTRVVELFITDPDPNNFYRRAISWGESKLFANTASISAYPDSSTLVGNMPTAKISTGNTTAPVKTRFSDTGNAFMQDTPTDAIYIRENTHLYAINPNTRSNITSYDFANQGGNSNHTAFTIASNIDNTYAAGALWNGETGRSPTATFTEGLGSTSTSLSSGGYGDLEGNTTFDLIYGDDTRLYLALKMNIVNVPYHTYGGQQYYQNQNNSYSLVRFHTGKDGTTIQCGERGPHPSPVDGIRNHASGTSSGTANYVVDREYYYFGLLNNYVGTSSMDFGSLAAENQGGAVGMFSGINLMYDNKRNNVWVVGRRDHENCNNPDGRINYSKMIVVPVGHTTVDFYHSDFMAWPSHTAYASSKKEPILANLGRAALYGKTGNVATTPSAITQLNDNGASGNADKVWFNSANYNSTDTPNGFERSGIISGQAINVTINGKTASNMDEYHPTLPNRGSQVYFSGMSNDASQYNSSHGTYPGTNARSGGYPYNTWTSPVGENRIGAVPFFNMAHETGGNDTLYDEPGYGNSNTSHNTAVNNSQSGNNNHLYNARIKLKTSQSTAVTAANNEEGIRCVWYYKGAFHGVTTFNEGTYVYMPEPEHGTTRNQGYGQNYGGVLGAAFASPNDNTNTVTHYVSQCESGQNSYNNVIGGSNTKIGTAEGCKNSDWAACVAPGGILCLPKQDSGYAKAGFIGINLGTKSILNTSSGSGQPFEAPSSVNPNNKQIKQMVVTSTGKIWAILDYENASASTLQFRILQVVFNSNYSSVTWSGGLYTSQASNSNSGHVKFYRTVCGNMPQSKMEWDAV